jgi:hypothetical protein
MGVMNKVKAERALETRRMASADMATMIHP